MGVLQPQVLQQQMWLQSEHAMRSIKALERLEICRYPNLAMMIPGDQKMEAKYQEICLPFESLRRRLWVLEPGPPPIAQTMDHEPFRVYDQ